MLVQEMEIALDEEFLRRLLSFALELAPYGDTPQSRSSGSERDQGTVFERAPVRWWQQGHPGSSEGSTASTRYFFQELQFNALCLNVSFRRVPSAVDQSLTLISPVTLTLNALGMVAMSVERSPLRLSGLKMSQVLQTRTGLVSRVVRHYRNQGLQVRPSLGFGHCPRRLLCSRCAHGSPSARNCTRLCFPWTCLAIQLASLTHWAPVSKTSSSNPPWGWSSHQRYEATARALVQHTCARTHSPTRGCLVLHSGLWPRPCPRISQPPEQHRPRCGNGGHRHREQRVSRRCVVVPGRWLHARAPGTHCSPPHGQRGAGSAGRR